MLLGLSTKSAMPILESAAAEPENGPEPVAAALERARLRLRPIVMNSSPPTPHGPRLEARPSPRVALPLILGLDAVAGRPPAAWTVVFSTGKKP